MYISLVGINHSTAPITMREKVAITVEQLPNSLSLLSQYIPYGIILSTCNRTEIYAPDGDGINAEEASITFLKAHLKVPDDQLRRHIYTFKDETTVKHLFRVACGLDSMIVGEYEILGQVKQALKVAEQAKMTNLLLRHLFQSAIRAGRQVREETGISKNALSVSSVAVDLAARIVSDLKNCKMLVIGAGEAGRLVAKAAKERGTSRIVVANRTKETASALAVALGGTAVTLDNLVDDLSSAHIAVTCTGAPYWVLEFRHVEQAMKTRSELPLVIIDIGVPRNVEPAVAQIKNVFLYNIDNLTEISNRNRQQRQSEIQQATDIIAAEVDEFIFWQRTLEIRPIIKGLMEKAEEIRCAQLKQTLAKLPELSEEARDSLEAMTKSIVTRILKEPISYLKTDAGNSRDFVETVRKLFYLNPDKSDEDKHNHRFSGE